MRRSLNVPLTPRDSSDATDARLTNCYTEKGPLGDMVIKRAGLAVNNSLGAGCAQGSATFNGDALFVKSDTIYTNFAREASGSSWTAATTPTKPAAGQAANGTTKTGYMLSLGSDLFHIGGMDSADTNFGVYKSADNGASWTTVLSPGSAPWPRFLSDNQMAVTNNGAMFILVESASGSGIWQVWRSSDGAVWVKTSSNLLGASYIYPHGLVASGGVMYALFSDATGVNGAVFESSDGITWSSKTTTAGWANRKKASAWTYNGSLYIGAGVNSASTLLNDVWKSTNFGVTWVQIAAAAAFSARDGAASFTYDGKIWIMGGRTGSGAGDITNNVYNSTDGITWTLVTAGAGWTARHLMSYTVHADTMYIGPGFNNAATNLTVTGLQYATLGSAVSTALPTPTQNCLPIQIALIPANGVEVTKAFIKSTKDAWVWDGTSITKVSDVDYPATTVYGVAYLQETIYVMDSKGIIYGSNLSAPLAWSALNFITANAEADAGVAIARQLDNIIAFKDTSIEFFYNAGNPTGSPLSKQENALMEVGCAAARSIAYSDNTIFFMSKHKQHGRSVMKFVGTTPQQISTPWVDRILDVDNLVDIYAFVIRTNGHVFYFLTMTNSNITLVYDDTAALWHQATSLSALPAASVSTIAVQANGSILVTMPLPHGALDGDPVTIAGGTPAAVNGLFALRYVSSTQFSYVPESAVSGSITGSVTAVLYSTGHFRGSHYADGIHSDLILDESNGSVYRVNPGITDDAGSPIDVHVRTEREDFSTMKTKSYNSLAVIADNVSSRLYVRYSSFDYSNFGKYRDVDLSKRRPMLEQLGSSERRAWEFRHVANTSLRLQAVEVEVQTWAG